MPEVINIYPMDVHAELRFSLSELNLLADFLDKCEYQGDLEDPNHKAEHEFVINKFFPFLNQLTDDLIKGFGHGSGPNST